MSFDDTYQLYFGVNFAGGESQFIFWKNYGPGMDYRSHGVSPTDFMAGKLYFSTTVVGNLYPFDGYPN